MPSDPGSGLLSCYAFGTNYNYLVALDGDGGEMLFQPIDEMSLRHLFSTDLGRRVLRMSYLGPVLDATGRIDTSPDAQILDMRTSPYRVRRAEFKFIPSSHLDFSHNGQFEVAIVWAIPSGISKQDLLNNLTEQNGCAEIIVLNNMIEFEKLPHFSQEKLLNIGNFADLKKSLLSNRTKALVAYIAAKTFPDHFHIDRVISYLSSKFPEVQEMKPQGRSNVVTALVQMRPPLAEFMSGRSYRWSGNFDEVEARSLLENWIRTNLRMEPPTDGQIREMIV